METQPNTQPNNLPAEATKKEDARSFNTFLLMLEDGALHADLSEALRELNAEMNNHAHITGGKSKGRLTLDIDFSLDGAVFEITSDFKLKLPKSKRARSVAWSTPGNNFTPNNPKQMTLFGVRDVTSSGSGDIRNV